MNSANRIRLIAATVATGLLAVLFAAPAVAAATPAGTPTTWSVVPAGANGADGRAAFAYSVKPGSLIQDVVAVTNRGATPENFNIYGTDAFTDHETGAFSLLVASQKPTGAGAWITLPVSHEQIAPGQEARIPFQLAVPTNATPGDHTAGVVASILVDGKAANGSNIKLEERVAARVYLHIIGPQTAQVISSGQSSGYTISLNPFTPGTANVSYNVKNVGNVRVDVEQTISVDGPFGIQLASFHGQTIRNLLPGDSVQQQQSAEAWPLLLLWTTVQLRTTAPTDTVLAADIRDLTGTTTAAQAAPKYTTTSTDSVSGAVPVLVLVIILVLVLLGVALVRYVRVSRERVYEAIEAASAEAAARSRIEDAAAADSAGGRSGGRS